MVSTFTVVIVAFVIGAIYAIVKYVKTGKAY